MEEDLEEYVMFEDGLEFQNMLSDGDCDEDVDLCGSLGLYNMQ